MSKTPKERAEQLAMKAAKAIHLSYNWSKVIGPLQQIQVIDDAQIINTTIPLVEYEECVEALKLIQEDTIDYIKINKLGSEALGNNCLNIATKALANVAAKLNEKGQP